MNRPLSIFLAEDNPGDVALVREALQEHNVTHRLFVAKDGAEAKRYIETMGTDGVRCPDILLLDLNLPKADGYELLASFRAHPLCAETPVILVTSSNAPDDRRRATALGATRYFRKPTDLTDFLELGRVIRDLAVERGL